MTVFWWVLCFVVVQRLAELLYARRNTARLLADGAVEHGRNQYAFIVALHGAWLASIALFVAPDTSPETEWLLAFGALQLFRIWILVSLGRRWTTRVVVLPGAPLVHHGPYRHLRHPNYLLVAAEIAVLPMMFGAWKIALIFSIANAFLLAWRIRVEEAALGLRGDTTA